MAGITPEYIVERDQSEHAHQVALFCWAASSGIADIDLLFHIPNGELRDKVTGGRLKAGGVKPGVPDVCWPVKTIQLGLGGLYIELKKDGNVPTKLQLDWMRRLRLQGYYATTAYSWGQAKDIILWYHNLR